MKRMELFAGILLLAGTLSAAATPPVGDEFNTFKGWYIRQGATAEIRDGRLYYQASFKGLNVLSKTFILAPDACPFFEIKIDQAKGIYNIRLQDEGGKVKAGQDRILIETRKYAPADWAGVNYLTLAGQNATVDLKLLENETFLRF